MRGQHRRERRLRQQRLATEQRLPVRLSKREAHNDIADEITIPIQCCYGSIATVTTADATDAVSVSASTATTLASIPLPCLLVLTEPIPAGVDHSK